MEIHHVTMAPFFIDIESDGNHTLKQLREPTPKRPKGYVSIEGYFPSVDMALKKLVKLKTAMGEGAIDLEAYVTRIETAVESISKINIHE